MNTENKLPETKVKYFVKPLRHLAGMDVGWGNGYVCLPEGHPCYGLDYDSIHDKYPELYVHGGLTFSCASKELKEGWGEIPEGCRENSWVIGFDCAHLGDSMSTCPKSYVEREAKKLASFMASIEQNL